MAKADRAKQLANLIADLQSERQRHADAVTEIDATLDRFGIRLNTASAPRGPGRSSKKDGTKKGRRRGRKSYSQTANEFVLGLVKSRSMTTREINEAWTAAGRKGKADNTLTKLTKAKQLKRKNIKGARGSQYTAS